MGVIHPITIRGIEIPSNVFFAPINPGGSVNGHISKDYIDFFVRHSGHGIGVCYVGNVALQKEWSSNDNTAVMSITPDKYWIELSRQIEKNGSLSGIQLAWKPPEMTLQRSFVANNKLQQLKLFQEFYNNFNDIETVADQFIDNIKHAAALGFSIIQIHAAHGYALSLLLSRVVSGCNAPELTKGSELIRKITADLNFSHIILDIRISLYEGIEDGFVELEYKMHLIEFLLECGFDMISLSNGFYNIDKTMIYPSKKEKVAILNEAENFARKHTDVLWNIAGNMENALMTKTTLPHNLTFSLGRQLLADPYTIIKMKNHTFNDIQRCSECNACHYYSHGLNSIKKCMF